MRSRVSSALRTWASAGGCAKESSEGGQEMQAAGGEIEPGKIEGKTQTASIRVIVQCPLRHAAHGDDALDAFRKGRSVAFCGQPVIESLSPHKSEEHTSELQSRLHLVCRLLLEKKKKK